MVGVCALLGIVVQVIVGEHLILLIIFFLSLSNTTLIIRQTRTGLQKAEALDRTNVKTRRWHGDLGLLTWDLLCLAIILGLFFFLRTSPAHLVLLALISLIWLAVHVQMRRKSPDLEWLNTTEKEVDVTSSHDILLNASLSPERLDASKLKDLEKGNE